MHKDVRTPKRSRTLASSRVRSYDEPFLYHPVATSGSGNGVPRPIREITTVSGLAQQLESGVRTGGAASFLEGHEVHRHAPPRDGYAFQADSR